MPKTKVNWFNCPVCGTGINGAGNDGGGVIRMLCTFCNLDIRIKKLELFAPGDRVVALQDSGRIYGMEKGDKGTVESGTYFSNHPGRVGDSVSVYTDKRSMGNSGSISVPDFAIRKIKQGEEDGKI